MIFNSMVMIWSLRMVIHIVLRWLQAKEVEKRYMRLHN